MPLRPRLALLALAAAALVAVVAERLVVTDREAIETLLVCAADDVSHGRWQALEAVIDEAYAERGRDRAAFVAFLRRSYELARPDGVGVDVFETNVDGDQATTRVVVNPGPPYRGVTIGGRVELSRRPDGWRIVRVAEETTRFLGR